MDKFANIGKSILIQSIGLQKNYIEVAESTTDNIDYSNTECINCKYNAIIQSFKTESDIYNKAVNECANCPHKIITQKTVYKKVYHNEKNYYGYKPMLKSNAIKLLLLLHFKHPDRFGIIKNIDINSLSDYISCDIKTIRNNLDILAEYNYISFSRTDTYIYNICLNNYDEYYLPASKGGRGFIVLSEDLLKQIIKIDNLVSLRIHIRQLIELDTLNIKGPYTALSKTYKDIKQTLPDYCKPCIIRSSIIKSSGIFNITIKDTSIRFEIMDIYNAKVQKEKCYNEYYAQFESFMNSFNKIVPLVNVNLIQSNEYSQFFKEKSENESIIYHLLLFTELQLDDLANLAMQYSFDHVIDALSVIYQTYIMKDRKIHNLGGLLQTVISTKNNTNLLAA